MSRAVTPVEITLLRKLRKEVKDWQEALSGEREGLDELCAQVDVALKARSGWQPPAPASVEVILIPEANLLAVNKPRNYSGQCIITDFPQVPPVGGAFTFHTHRGRVVSVTAVYVEGNRIVYREI